jgi:hypothetical protein
MRHLLLFFVFALGLAACGADYVSPKELEGEWYINKSKGYNRYSSGQSDTSSMTFPVPFTNKIIISKKEINFYDSNGKIATLPYQKRGNVLSGQREGYLTIAVTIQELSEHRMVSAPKQQYYCNGTGAGNADCLAETTYTFSK